MAMAMEASVAAKVEGNTAYAAGDLELAVGHYSAALEHWDEALEVVPKPKVFSKRDVVVYNSKGFASVESAFTVMDEYFLKDLGTDKPIWVGDAGGNLKRFSRSDLQLVPQDLFDLRLACAQNLSAVKLKQEDFTLAIKWADEALRMDGRAPKALMRKGAALLKKGQAGPASAVLLTAQEVSPKDAEVKRLLREAEKGRGPEWVCASGCCGPWGIQNHMLTPAPNLNTIGKGKGTTLGSIGPMKFGPTTAGTKIAADDDSDSDCSTCSGNDNADCFKKMSPEAPEKTFVPEAKPAVPMVSSAPEATSPADVAATSMLENEQSSDARASSMTEETRAVGSAASVRWQEPESALSEESDCQKVHCQKEHCQKVHCQKVEHTASPQQEPRTIEKVDESGLLRPAASSKSLSKLHHCHAIAAASFAAMMAMAVAWQLGNLGAMASVADTTP